MSDDNWDYEPDSPYLTIIVACAAIYGWVHLVREVWAWLHYMHILD